MRTFSYRIYVILRAIGYLRFGLLLFFFVSNYSQIAFAQTRPNGSSPSSHLREADEEAAQHRIAFLLGLRERGLYRLAEKAGLQEWQAATLSKADRARLAIEMAQTYADWAITLPPNMRAGLWNKAHAVLAKCAELHPGHSHNLLLKLQSGLAWLTQGELERLEADAVSSGDTYRSAKLSLRKAIAQLEKVRAEASEALRNVRMTRPSDRTASESLSEMELSGIERNVAIATAAALRNQALCYPAKSTDRTNALLRALEHLEQPGILKLDNGLGWDAQVAWVTCSRLLGRGEVVRKRLVELAENAPPSDVAVSLHCEAIRLLIDAGKIETAISKSSTSSNHSEILHVHLEGLLAAWTKAIATNKGLLAEERSKLITQQIARIRALHKPAWTRKAEILVGHAFAKQIASGSATPGGSDAGIDALQLAAESMYRAGKTTSALAAYDRAVQQALQLKQMNRAFDLAFTAAAVTQHAGHLPEASQRYRKLAQAQPKHEKAAAAHRLAILCASESAHLAKDTTTRKQALEQYAMLLRKHIAMWEHDPTTSEVLFWLGSLQQSKKAHQTALGTFAKIAPTSLFAQEAIPKEISCFRALLQKANSPESKKALIQQATQRLQPVITGPKNRWPKTWTPLQQHIALELAEMHIGLSPQGDADASTFLLAALQGDPEKNQGETNEGVNRNSPKNDPPNILAETAWQIDAHLLLLEAYFNQADAVRFSVVFKRLPSSANRRLIPLVQSAIPQLQDPANTQAKQQAIISQQLTARLQQHLDVASVQGNEQDELKTSLKIANAAAMAALGNRKEAKAAYQSLVKRHPRNGAIQAAFAALLANSTLQNELEESLKLWNKIERRSKPGGLMWFRARLARCQQLNRLGRSEEAKKLLLLTKTLHPELGGPKLKQAFLAMEKEL